MRFNWFNPWRYGSVLGVVVTSLLLAGCPEEKKAPAPAVKKGDRQGEGSKDSPTATTPKAESKKSEREPLKEMERERELETESGRDRESPQGQ